MRIKILLIKNIYFVIGLLLTAALIWPLLYAPYFTHHENAHLIRLDQMHKCILDLQLPCRWSPDLGVGYGYPFFNFYPPLPYYIGEIFYLLTGSLLVSIKILFGISLLGSFVFMYLLGRKLWGDLGGFISGIFYSYAPFHAVVLYVRGDMSEMWALMLYPAIFWSIIRLKEKTTTLNMLILSFVVAGLLLSHNISGLIFLPFAIILALILSIKQKGSRFLRFYILSLVLSLLLASFYIVPIVFERHLIDIESTTEGYFAYTEHFKGLKKLIIDRSWGWGMSIREIPGGVKDGLSFQVGIIHILALLSSVLVAILNWQKQKQLSILILFFLGAAIFSIFMVNPKSQFIWDILTPLKYLQFPWRFLMITIFFGSLLAGSILLALEKVWFKLVVTSLLIVLVILSNFFYFRPEKFINQTEDQLVSGDELNRQVRYGILDFRPLSIESLPFQTPEYKYKILSGNARINNFQTRSNGFDFSINANSLTFIQISQFYFPNWQVKVGNELKDINYKNESGLIIFTVDPGEWEVKGEFADTRIRLLGNFLTIIGILLCIAFLLWQFKRTKRIMIYLISGLNR